MLTQNQALTLLTPWRSDQREFFLSQYQEDKTFRTWINQKVNDYRQDPHIFVTGDYSQAEVRVAGELSKESKILDFYARVAEAEAQKLDMSKRPDLDFHTCTAGDVYEKPVAKVTEWERKYSKSITFALLYGAGAYRIAQETGLPLKTAEILLQNFWAAYPRIRSWVNEIVEEATKKGYVTTPLGRRKATLTLLGKAEVLRAFISDENFYQTLKPYYTYETIKEINREIRQARNFPVQSYASDIVTSAGWLFVKDCEEAGLDLYVHTLVHDSLGMSIPLSQLPKLIELFKYNLEERISDEFGLNVPLKVDIEIGFTYDTKDVKLPNEVDSINWNEFVNKAYEAFCKFKAETIIGKLAENSLYLFKEEHRKPRKLTKMEQEEASLTQREFEHWYKQYQEYWGLKGKLKKERDRIAPAVLDIINKVEEQYLD